MIADTQRVALDRYHELLAAQEPHQRLAQSVALTQAVRELAVAGIRQRHPGASLQEIRIRLATRLYGRQAALRLFGEIPDDAI